jgi:hypothetical protein
MLQFFDTLTDVSGNALLGATVAVSAFPGGGAATIYQTNGTSMPVANSTVISDVTGQVSFYAPDGAYILTYSYKGAQYKVRSPVQLLDPLGFIAIADSGASSNNYALTDQRLPAQKYVGLKVEMLAANGNTGDSLLDYQADGGYSILQPGGTQLLAGMIQPNGLTRLEWDGAEWQLIGSQSQPFYGITAAEQAAGVTPVNFSYPAQTAIRYATNTTPGTTDMTAGIQAAIDSASPTSPAVLLSDSNLISAPLLIRSTTQENISLNGNGQVVTILTPKSATIAVSPQNINCLIFNQNNNAHLHLSHLRQADTVGFSGYFMYALPGGGGDASALASFSTVVDDCWFSPSSANNGGIFYGFYSNMQLVNCTFESTKSGCLRFVGGSSDILAVNMAMSSCYDSFIYGADDTTVKTILSVNGLHVYGHLRGPAFEIKNGYGLAFQDILYEASPSNLGGTGLFKFTDCTNVLCANATCRSGTDVAQAAIAIQLINGCTGKFSNILSDALIGVQFSGAGVLDVEFENCDFSGTHAVPINVGIQILSGSQSGQVIFRGCRFNFTNLEGFIDSAGTNSADWYFYDCEFVNSGMGGVNTNYNFDTALSGNVYLIRCRIGQNDASAAGNYYLNANGAGAVFVIDPLVVGTPPGASFAHGTQVPTYDGIDSSMGGMPQFVPSLGGSTTYTLQNGTWSLKNKTLHFQGALTINAIGTGAAGTISGLPFAAAGTTYGGGGCHIDYYTGLAASYVNIAGFIDQTATSIKLRGATAAAAANGNVNALTSSSAIIFSGAYRVYL